MAYESEKKKEALRREKIKSLVDALSEEDLAALVGERISTHCAACALEEIEEGSPALLFLRDLARRRQREGQKDGNA